MNIAILIGQGPEADALLARADSLSANFILFETNLSGAAKANPDLPVIDLFDPERAQQKLHAHNVSRIIMIGLLQPAGPRVPAGKPRERLNRLISTIFNGEDPNQATRKHIRSLLRPGFKFPAAKSVLPPIPLPPQRRRKSPTE